MDNVQLQKEKVFEIRRNIRDSVFQTMVKDRRYLKRIYLSLHPEDSEIREEDLTLIHGDPVFIGAAIEDCCFKVRDEKVIFIEVQSTLCRLLPERMLRYWAECIPMINPEYNEKQYSVYGTKMPECEFYSIYVGEKGESVPEYYFLGDHKEPMPGRIHIPIRVFTEYNSIGEVYEYCVFSHIYRDKMQGHKDRRKAIVRATLSEALEREVLRDFLDDHMEEVKKIMSETNEYYFTKYVEGVTKDAEKRGENKEKKASLNKIEALMKKKGVPETEIKDFLNEYSMI